MAAKRILAILSASLIPVQALPSFLNSPPVIQPYTGSPRPSPRRLVDKFAQDTDGKWRKVEDFELYGNRICVNCDHEPGSSSGSVATVIPHEDLIKNLPPGWHHPKPTATSHRTSVIMSLSIVLAIGISLLAVTYFNHRENRKRRLKNADLELRPSSTSSTPTPSLKDSQRSLDIRARMRAWASATARWRTNARYAMRQRRGKRVAETLACSTSRDTFSLRRVHSSTISPARSRSSSILPPTSSSEQAIATDEDELSSHPTSPTLSLLPPPTPDLPEIGYLPPAYHHPPPGTTHADATPTGKTASSTAAPEYTSSTVPSGEAVAHTSSAFHVGHVATDDKAILNARVVNEPPTASSSASLLQSSAPEWRDEELHDFGPELEQSTSASSPAYPPPPPTHPAFHFPRPSSRSSLSSVAKGKMATVYSASYDQYGEDTMGPSAPPFSDHRFSNFSLHASAPPAFDMDVSPPQLEASAPTFDEDGGESSPRRSASHLPPLDMHEPACRIPLPPDAHGDYEPLDMPHDPRPG
ncbi:hypothetical protein BDV98DRAFT_655023 [Pterulicium gracile]|uniref:Uncharacterized protein n=1 Tax=Pterulicium gracile TaxID=1884261 RepID=A0A5C3QP36_9AGAR|nr:hypothetical protein BDV98DRAFT_655023 [Pterula gracilis]